MDRRRRSKAFVDIFVVCVLTFTFIAVRWWTTPLFRGYFESDMSIRYPFIMESIPMGVLGGVGGVLFLLAVVATEAIRHKQGLYINEVVIGGRIRKEWLFQVATYLSIYLYGLFSSLIIVYVGKYALGRLRPHFIDVCRPDVRNDSWSAGQNSLGYIRSYTCRSMSWYRVDQASISFPSAHASFAMYTTIFFILYLEKKAKWHVAKSMRHLVQFGAILATWCVGSTRLVENWSHWSDVAAGYLIGGVFAVAFFYYNFMSKSQKKEEENSMLSTNQQPINVSVVNQQPMDQPPQYHQPINVLPNQPPQYQQPINVMPMQQPLDQPPQYQQPINVLPMQQPLDQSPQYQMNYQAELLQTDVDVKVAP